MGIRGNSGSFNSVNFPKSNYPNDLTCRWHLVVDEGREVVLTFGKFYVERSIGCTYDAVTVYGEQRDGGLEFLGKYCEASQIPKQIVARGNGMYVTFTSDSSGNDVGFGATYTSRPASADPVTTATTTTTAEPTTTTRRPTTTAAPTTTSGGASDCSNCPEMRVEGQCGTSFYALYARVARVKRKRTGQLSVLVVVQKVLKHPGALKRKSKLTLTLACPTCYPTFKPRGKLIITGTRATGTASGGLLNPASVAVYKKKEFKRLKALVKSCTRGAGRRKRKRKKRNHSD